MLGCGCLLEARATGFWGRATGFWGCSELWLFGLQHHVVQYTFPEARSSVLPYHCAMPLVELRKTCSHGRRSDSNGKMGKSSNITDRLSKVVLGSCWSMPVVGKHGSNRTRRKQGARNQIVGQCAPRQW